MTDFHVAPPMESMEYIAPIVYVGETGRSLRSRMNGDRSAIKKGGQSLLHKHFHQPAHSVDDMRVKILEKVYSSDKPALSTSLRWIRELHWIKGLGTAKPYGFNDQIKGVGTLSSTSCKKTNIYALFNKHPRRKRSHGKRHYKKKPPQPESSMDTLLWTWCTFQILGGGRVGGLRMCHPPYHPLHFQAKI